MLSFLRKVAEEDYDFKGPLCSAAAIPLKEVDSVALPPRQRGYDSRSGMSSPRSDFLCGPVESGLIVSHENLDGAIGKDSLQHLRLTMQTMGSRVDRDTLNLTGFGNTA